MLTVCQCNDVFSIAQIMSDCSTTANPRLFWVYTAACYCGCWLLVYICIYKGRCMYASMHCVLYTIYRHQQYGSLPHHGCVWISAIYRVCALKPNTIRICSCSCFCPSENNVQQISYIIWSYASPHLHSYTKRVFTNTILLYHYAMNGILCFCLIPFSFVIVTYKCQSAS